MLIVQFIARHFQKRVSPARLEVDSRHHVLLRRIDHEKLRVRTANDAAVKRPELVRVLPVVQPDLVFREVEHHLHRPVRQQPLPLMRRPRKSLIQPQQIDKIPQRRPRMIRAENHKFRPVYRTPPSEGTVVGAGCRRRASARLKARGKCDSEYFMERTA